jgi:hypothetical protein
MAKMKKALEATRRSVRREVNSALAEMGIKTRWKLKLLTRLESFVETVYLSVEYDAYHAEDPKEARGVRKTGKTLLEWLGREGKGYHLRGLELKRGMEREPESLKDENFEGIEFNTSSWEEFAKKKGLDEGQIEWGSDQIFYGGHATVHSLAPKDLHVLIPFKGVSDSSMSMPSEVGHLVYQIACDHRGLRPDLTVHEMFDVWFKYLHGLTPARFDGEGKTFAPSHIPSAALVMRILANSKSFNHAKRVMHSLATREFEDFDDIKKHVDAELAKKATAKEGWPLKRAREWDETLSVLTHTLNKTDTDTELGRQVRASILMGGTRHAFINLLANRAESAKKEGSEKAALMLARKILRHTKQIMEDSNPGDGHYKDAAGYRHKALLLLGRGEDAKKFQTEMSKKRVYV